MRVQTARRAAVLGMLATCALTRGARADDAELDARAAYDRGLAAHEHGDEETAAHEFARADELKPSNAALEAAVASSIRASDPVFGMSLVERAKGRELDPGAQATIARARSAFANRVVTIVVDCQAARSCRLSLDGTEARDASHPVIVAPGAHEVVVSRDGSIEKLALSAQGGEIVRMGGASRAALPSPAPTPDSGSDWAKPAALGAIGVTLVLAGVTVASFADLHVTRSDFDREHCGMDAPATTSPGPDCARFSDAGRSAETRTNLLLVGSILAGAATAAFVIVAKPFASKSDVRMTASLGPTGALFSFHTP